MCKKGILNGKYFLLFCLKYVFKRHIYSYWLKEEKVAISCLNIELGVNLQRVESVPRVLGGPQVVLQLIVLKGETHKINKIS
jgi:hypothetical protein